MVRSLTGGGGWRHGVGLGLGAWVLLGSVAAAPVAPVPAQTAPASVPVQAAPAPAARAAPVEFSAQVRRSNAKQPERNAQGVMMVSRWGVRTEGVVDKQRVQFIYHPDRQTMLVLFPDQLTYVEHANVDLGQTSLPDDPQSPCRANPAVTCRNLGPVSWNGRQPIRWEVTEKGLDNKTQRSYLYVDPRLQVVIREEYPDGTIQEFVTIQEGVQPQQLFTLPTGYRKITTSAAGGATASPAP